MKVRIDDLAIFGGKAAFNEKLHVGLPNIGSRERLLERINDLLDRRRLTNNGPFVQELEQKISVLLGVKHCIAMCNGTIALEIAIRAAGLKGEVIVPSFTFVATAHALQWQEIVPVFCDIDPGTHNLDPKRVEEMITPRTTGIIGVHLWGRPCNVDALAEIARRHNLKLLFDAAHAFACSFGSLMIGNFGEAEIFSFHATKFFHSFEGGAVTTNNDKLAEKIRLMKNFGFKGFDNVIHTGTNGKMSEVSAAMGLTSLEDLDHIISANRRTYELYRSELGRIKGISIVKYQDENKQNYQFVAAEVDESVTGISRDEIIRILHAENIVARRYFYPGCHRMEPYRSKYPEAGLSLPHTEELCKKILVLPAGASITAQDLQKVCFLLDFVLRNSSDISGRLAN